MRKILILPLLLFVSACGASHKKPITLNMTPAQLQETSPVSLCLDDARFSLPAVSAEVQRRGLNCHQEIYNKYTQASQKLSHVELCNSWMHEKVKSAVQAFDAEIKNRNIDCKAILSIKAQQDNANAIEDANRWSRWDRLDRSRYYWRDPYGRYRY